MEKEKRKVSRICLCSSASFFKEVLEIEKELKKMGFSVSVPLTSKKMEKSGNFDVSHYKNWYKDKSEYRRKAYLMRNHFEKIEKSDAILVVNLKKNGLDGYIGGNGLIEMALAFWLKKKIFVLNKVSEKSSLYEEILGVQPIFLDADLNRLRV
ncbi:MAG: hypothetical protein WD231_02480 [Candidatus Woykebacteria bacterium]